MDLEYVVNDFMQKVPDKKYKGIIKHKDNYIVTDGFRIIMFKDYMKYKELIEEHLINVKLDNMPFLNIDFDAYSNIETIDSDKLKQYIDYYDKTKMKLPYIVKKSNFYFGLDPIFVKEALELIGNNTFYIANENLKPIIFRGESLDYILLPIKLDGDEDTYKLPEMRNGEYCIQTAKEMYNYCVQNGFGSGWNEKWALKHFNLIENSLMNDEYVKMVFIGLHNYISSTKHDGFYAYAITNKRIIMAQQKVFGHNFQTISLDNINDITFSSGMAFGKLTIDTIKETFNVQLDKVSAKKISDSIHIILDNLKKLTKNSNIESNSNSVADEIKKFKELLDIGAITQEEYDKKKNELLNR